MIFDRLENWRAYPLGSAWEDACEFLTALPLDCPEGETQLRGQDLYVRVLSYQSCARREAALEAHREYADVHCVLAGVERIEWYPADTLEIKVPYDPARDAEFYTSMALAPLRADLRYDRFAVFFPGDAHRTQISTTRMAGTIKKAVVKIRAALLRR
ncbi:MAG: YhcH/YjgK/YiaL family protein [bacterium]|nr:YhcH/YjgK/YiaL family protein [bacterium]